MALKIENELFKHDNTDLTAARRGASVVVVRGSKQHWERELASMAPHAHHGSHGSHGSHDSHTDRHLDK
jgi:hypothetical protein